MIPWAPPSKAAFTAAATSSGCVFFSSAPVGMSTSMPGQILRPAGAPATARRVSRRT